MTVRETLSSLSQRFDESVAELRSEMRSLREDQKKILRNGKDDALLVRLARWAGAHLIGPGVCVFSGTCVLYRENIVTQRQVNVEIPREFAAVNKMLDDHEHRIRSCCKAVDTGANPVYEMARAG